MTTLETARCESASGDIARNSPGYSIAPVATMTPWPGIRRGTDAVVPRVPGLVSEIVVPSKSETSSFPARARATTSSEAARNCEKLIAPAPLTLGTTRERVPSFFSTSTAMPKLILSRRTRTGASPESSKASFKRGKSWRARRIAQAMRCVKETFDSPREAR